MGRKILEVSSTERITRLLEKEYSRKNIPNSMKLRIGIILDGIAGMSNYESYRKCGTTEFTGRKWRHRWQDSFLELKAKEELGLDGTGSPATDSELLKLIYEILGDLPRSGAPKKFTLSQVNQIITLASQKPEDHGVPMSQWTYEMLAQVAQTKKIVDYISVTHVGTLLKKTN